VVAWCTSSPTYLMVRFTWTASVGSWFLESPS